MTAATAVGPIYYSTSKTGEADVDIDINLVSAIEDLSPEQLLNLRTAIDLRLREVGDAPAEDSVAERPRTLDAEVCAGRRASGVLMAWCGDWLGKPDARPPVQRAES